MATIQTRIQNWAKGRTRGQHQINMDVCLLRWNRGRRELEKRLVFFARSDNNSDEIFMNLVAGKQRYELPIGSSDVRPAGGLRDFGSIIQLEIGYETLVDGTPDRKKCEAIYTPEWEQDLLDTKNYKSPRYRFDGKNAIILFPIPEKSISSGIYLRYGFMGFDVKLSDDESITQIPHYLLDVIDDYMTFMQKSIEDPSQRSTYKQERKDSLDETLGIIKNKDERAVKEKFLNLLPLM